MLKKLKNAYKFLGKQVALLMALDFFIGVMWFMAESGFLFVFQGFLLSINLLSLESIKLPNWYPVDLTSNLIILTFYGLMRAFLIGAKKVIPAMASQAFALDQRRNILGTSFFLNEKRSTAESLGSFGELVNKASQFVLHGSHALSSVAVAVLLVGFSLKLAWIETLVSIGLLVLVMLPLRGFNKRIRKNGEGVVREWNNVNKVLVDGIKNIFLLRLYHLTGFEFENGVLRLKAYETHRNRYLLISAVITSAPLFLGLLIISVVTFLSRKYLMTPPLHFVAFLYLFLRQAQNLSQLNTSLSSMLFYKDSFLGLYKWAPSESWEPHNQTLRHSTIVRSKTNVEIEVLNLRFGYSRDQVILRDLSIHIKPGELALIKGPSGVGKSTLVKIIVGMEDPQEGIVKINGVSAQDFMKENYERVAYVGPEPFLIPGTVRENLSYGNFRTLSDDEIWQSLQVLSMDKTVQSMTKSLDEHLHEETQLSTGQKQRLSFARAVLRKPILLILDEATANIDYQTEQIILDYLKRSKSKMTVIAISHRESFDELADKRILMLEQSPLQGFGMTSA